MKTIKWLIGKFKCNLIQKGCGPVNCDMGCFYECPYWRKTYKEYLLERIKNK